MMRLVAIVVLALLASAPVASGAALFVQPSSPGQIVVKRSASTISARVVVRNGKVSKPRLSTASLAAVVPAARRLVLEVRAADHGVTLVSWVCTTSPKAAKAGSAVKDSLAKSVIESPIYVNAGFSIADDGTVTSWSTSEPASLDITETSRGFARHRAPFDATVDAAECKAGQVLWAAASRDDQKPFTLTLVGSR